MSSPSKEVFLAPFNPTCEHAQDVALGFLKLTGKDVLFDMGCGDGRLLVKAIRQSPVGLRCVGIEIDPTFVERANQRVASLKLPTQNTEPSQLIDIRHGDVLEEISFAPELSKQEKRDDITSLTLLQDATAVFLYLLPAGLRKVTPELQEIMNTRSSMRIVSYMFAVPGWKPTAVDRSTKGGCPVYFYSRTADSPTPPTKDSPTPTSS